MTIEQRLARQKQKMTVAWNQYQETVRKVRKAIDKIQGECSHESTSTDFSPYDRSTTCNICDKEIR